MTDTLTKLRAISLPGESPEEYQQALRTLLEAAAPLVMKGTIQTVKNEVNRALSLPLDGSIECTSAHFWALHEGWPYIHWDRISKPIPEDRQHMIDLYRDMRDCGTNPFDTPRASRPTP